MTKNHPETIILGGGLAGLSAGYALTKADRPVEVIEAGRGVGGLARTIEHKGFRFDLGGHRFLTGNKTTERFIVDLLGDELVESPRKSKILLRGRYFDYPLKPVNALFGLGIPETIRILSGYCCQRLYGRSGRDVSLEDWVVRRFGRRMFELYFRDYSEKVWGLPCSEISAEWVSKRIAGLSLGEAIKNAFSRRSGSRIPTLSERFLYPTLGIGRISERLRDGIEPLNRVTIGTQVLGINHQEPIIKTVITGTPDRMQEIEVSECISTIPLTTLVQTLNPAAPPDVREAAAGLRFRDLIVVAVMIDRDRVTDLSWMYLPEKQMSLGRIHEPKNWSAHMAPPGKTHLVAEYFCCRDDEMWKASDAELTDRTVAQLGSLGLFRKQEVLGSRVVRVPRAYPILDTEYRSRHARIMQYLSRFRNLHIAGRGGTFQYLNMDHAIESGMAAAEVILRKEPLCHGYSRMNTDKFVETNS